MITQIAACISNFREEEGGPELVAGSNDVGFDSWQGKLEIFTCFLVQKGTVWGAVLGLLCLLGASPGRRCSKMTLVGEHRGLGLYLLLCFCPAFQLRSVSGRLVLKFYTR